MLNTSTTLALGTVVSSLLGYIGPSTGITLLGALAAVILAILFAVGGVLAWPFRALMRRRRVSSQRTEKATTADQIVRERC